MPPPPALRPAPAPNAAPPVRGWWLQRRQPVTRTALRCIPTTRHTPPHVPGSASVATPRALSAPWSEKLTARNGCGYRLDRNAAFPLPGMVRPEAPADARTAYGNARRALPPFELRKGPPHRGPILRSQVADLQQVGDRVRRGVLDDALGRLALQRADHLVGRGAGVGFQVERADTGHVRAGHRGAAHGFGAAAGHGGHDAHTGRVRSDDRAIAA